MGRPSHDDGQGTPTVRRPVRGYVYRGEPPVKRVPAKHSSQAHRYCERCGHTKARCVCAKD